MGETLKHRRKCKTLPPTSRKEEQVDVGRQAHNLALSAITSSKKQVLALLPGLAFFRNADANSLEQQDYKTVTTGKSVFNTLRSLVPIPGAGPILRPLAALKIAA
jgi:hypothetical protein